MERSEEHDLNSHCALIAASTKPRYFFFLSSALCSLLLSPLQDAGLWGKGTGLFDFADVVKAVP